LNILAGSPESDGGEELNSDSCTATEYFFSSSANELLFLSRTIIYFLYKYLYFYLMKLFFGRDQLFVLFVQTNYLFLINQPFII
jgi:hypothetical protein